MLLQMYFYVKIPNYVWGFPGGSDSKESACNTGDLGSIPGLGRSPGEENGNSLHCCLEHPMGRGAWWVTVHGVTISQTTERLSTEHNSTAHVKEDKG